MFIRYVLSRVESNGSEGFADPVCYSYSRFARAIASPSTKRLNKTSPSPFATTLISLLLPTQLVGTSSARCSRCVLDATFSQLPHELIFSLPRFAGSCSLPRRFRVQSRHGNPGRRPPLSTRRRRTHLLVPRLPHRKLQLPQLLPGFARCSSCRDARFRIRPRKCHAQGCQTFRESSTLTLHLDRASGADETSVCILTDSSSSVSTLPSSIVAGCLAPSPPSSHHPPPSESLT